MTWGHVARVHAGHTVAGLVATAGVAVFAPRLLPWMAPILAGLVLSIPISWALAHVGLGRALRRRSLLLVPEERHAPEVLARFRLEREFAQVRAARHGTSDPVRRVLLDPVLHEVHLDLLRANPAARDEPPVAARANDPDADRRALLSNEMELRRLHRAVWAQS